MIRHAIPADLEETWTIYENNIEKFKARGIEQWTLGYPSREVIERDIVAEELYLCTEMDNPTIVGAVVLNSRDDAEYREVEWAYPEDRPLIVHRLAVHPNYHGRGIGWQLLRFTEEYAFKHGYDAVRLDTFSGNPDSLRLYTRNGYEHRGTVYFHGHTLPFYCFEKHLASEDTKDLGNCDERLVSEGSGNPA